MKMHIKHTLYCYVSLELLNLVLSVFMFIIDIGTTLIAHPTNKPTNQPTNQPASDLMAGNLLMQ